MYWDAKRVKALPDHNIYVELADGKKGVFDMQPYLNFGVFKELKNRSYFERVGIVFGAATWPNNQDIAPETLVAKLQLDSQCL
jgi:hypothetical protein